MNGLYYKMGKVAIDFPLGSKKGDQQLKCSNETIGIGIKNMNTDSAEYKKGLTLLQQLHGGEAGEQLVADMKDICPDYAVMTIEWALGGVMARPGLDLLTREFLLIASCVTLGHVVPQLRAHIASAIKLGATKEQIVEVILQMTFYAGGAATSNALRTAKEVFREKLSPTS